eukprot:1139014-Pelagomonas_calceolata.AAC.1
MHACTHACNASSHRHKCLEGAKDRYVVMKRRDLREAHAAATAAAATAAAALTDLFQPLGNAWEIHGKSRIFWLALNGMSQGFSTADFLEAIQEQARKAEGGGPSAME